MGDAEIEDIKFRRMISPEMEVGLNNNTDGMAEKNARAVCNRTPGLVIT
jgi:hypothetical protein